MNEVDASVQVYQEEAARHVYPLLMAWLNSDSAEIPAWETIDYRPVEDALTNAISTAWLLGRLHTQEAIAEQFQNFADLPEIVSAVEVLRAKVGISVADWEKALEKIMIYSSYLARITTADGYTKIHQAFKYAVESGLTKREWVQSLTAPGIINQVGFGIEKRPWYWENVFRTNTHTAYNAGKWAEYQNNKKLIKYLEYIAIDDNRTTVLCRSLNGTKKPIDDPVWSKYYPPNHYQCRSTTAVITERAAERLGITETPGTPSPEFPAGNESFEGNAGQEFMKIPMSIKERAQSYRIQQIINDRIKEIKVEVKKLRQ